MLRALQCSALHTVLFEASSMATGVVSAIASPGVSMCVWSTGLYVWDLPYYPHINPRRRVNCHTASVPQKASKHWPHTRFFRSRFFSTGNTWLAVLPVQLTRPVADFYLSTGVTRPSKLRLLTRKKWAFRGTRREILSFFAALPPP